MMICTVELLNTDAPVSGGKAARYSVNSAFYKETHIIKRTYFDPGLEKGRRYCGEQSGDFY